MMRSLILVTLCVIYVHADKPDFCDGLDCPAFTVVETTDDYELREYSPSTWVSAHGQSSDNGLFMKLFKYIQGANAQKEKIPMTVPVINQHSMDGSTVTNDYVMSFYMDHNNPPQPEDSDLEVLQMPSMRVYVRSYGWWSSESKVQKHLTELKNALPEGTSVDYSKAYSCGYDSPWTILGRHNEVWLIEQ